MPRGMIRNFVLLFIVLLALPAYGGTTVDTYPAGVDSITCDSCIITRADTPRRLTKSEFVYETKLYPRDTNAGRVYVGSSSSMTITSSHRLVVTAGAVEINIKNIQDLWVLGDTVGDRIDFIAEIRK